MKNNPNVILVFVDDLGYEDISCLNSESKVQKKYVNAMIKEGMIFSDKHPKVVRY